jgi:hypothetical protein
MIKMAYNKDTDPLYDVAHYASEFLILEEQIGQIFHVMNESAQWGGENGVDFHGKRIRTGNAKSTHQWWTKFISTKGTTDKKFSPYDDPILKIAKDLLKIILSSMRMNLYIHDVVVASDDDEDGKHVLCQINEAGELFEVEGGLEGEVYVKKMIAWIIDPLEVLCLCLGEILNDINIQVFFGQDDYNNYAEILRGAKGNLLETITARVLGKLKEEYALPLSIVRERPWDHTFIRPVYFHGSLIT